MSKKMDSVIEKKSVSEDIEPNESLLTEDFDIPEELGPEIDVEEEKQTFTAIHQHTTDATQIYLNEIGFSPLLSAEEEVYFAKLALKGNR